jgi:septum formation protein
MGTSLNMALPEIVLASASPARKQLLRNVGITPTVIVSSVDEPAAEAAAGWKSPTEIAQGLAALKAADVATRLSPNTLVIGCDSVMEFAGAAYGKPDSTEIAVERLRMMSGGSGHLHTGHSVGLITEFGVEWRHALCSTEVHFHEMSEPEIAAYVQTGEPLRVAGSYTLDYWRCCKRGWAFCTNVASHVRRIGHWLGRSFVTSNCLVRKMLLRLRI